MRTALAAAALLVGAAGAAPPLLAGPLPSQGDWAGARQELTTADGQRLTYVEVDPTPGSPGAEDDPLVLLHGYTDNSRSWSLLIPHLEGRHVYALDLRGHGGSDAPACCYGIDSLAHDLGGALDALGLDRVDLVGHSLGSITAGVFAAEHPERVDRLVLVSTALAVPEASTAWLWDNVPSLPATVDPESEFMLAWYWNPTPVDDDFLSRERAESAAVPSQVWMGVLRGLTDVDWSYDAARLEPPTLILWGDQDSLFDAASQERLHAALPQAETETYEGLGHNMFWEAPERVGARIAAFLDE